MIMESRVRGRRGRANSLAEQAEHERPWVISSSGIILIRVLGMRACKGNNQISRPSNKCAAMTGERSHQKWAGTNSLFSEICPSAFFFFLFLYLCILSRSEQVTPTGACLIDAPVSR